LLYGFRISIFFALFLTISGQVIGTSSAACKAISVAASTSSASASSKS
jgi:ABC-type microcin C transport system permease subunit YejE